MIQSPTDLLVRTRICYFIGFLELATLRSGAMEKHLLLFLFLFTSSFVNGYIVIAAGTEDGSEQWGYVEVRPKAHLFWWLYKSPYRVEDPSKPWPILLWLQGGPGGSGVGFGNFMEIGPLDGNLQPRNYTWLKKADLLFVDSPVGAGFSYMEDKNLVVRTDEQSATDLTTVLKEIFNGNETLQKSPLYIFAESYGGKFAVTLGVSALRAIEAGELKLQLAGVALGDSWISPEDFASQYAPLLSDLSRMNKKGLNESNSLVLKIKHQLAEGKYENATTTWFDLNMVISNYSNNVNFYNFLVDDSTDPTMGTTSEQFKGLGIDTFSKYLSPKKFSIADAGEKPVDLYSLMNGPIRKKLKIIPENVTWGAQGGLVYEGLMGDIMKPRIKEVDELLAKGINVTIYNGQLDLICATKGAETWIQKLNYDGLTEFLSLDRAPLYCGNDNSSTRGFVSAYNNFSFYWILGAGHFVPIQQPCVSLEMVGNVTRSPNYS